MTKETTLAFNSEKNIDDISIQEVNDVEEFRSLRETWNDLLGQCPDNNIFLTWEWLFTWWQHFGKDKKLKIFLIKESDRIIAIAPFMQWKYRKGIFSIDLIENICAMECDYSGIILTKRRQESMKVLLNYLEKITRDSHVIVRMSHIPENCSFVNVLREQYPLFSKSISLHERPISLCPYIDLPAKWEDFISTLSQNARRNIRRSERDLQKEHTVEFKKYDSNGGLQDGLQVLFDFHQKRWQEKNSSKFNGHEARNFYSDISEAFHQNNWLGFSFLNVDGKPVSAIWGFNYNNTFWAMTQGWNPDYSKYGVSQLHLAKLIEDTINNGRGKFDLLKGYYAFKSHWTNSIKKNIQVILAKNSFWGRYRIKLLKLLIKYNNLKTRSFHDNLSRLLKRGQYTRRPITIDQ